MKGCCLQGKLRGLQLASLITKGVYKTGALAWGAGVATGVEIYENSKDDDSNSRFLKMALFPTFAALFGGMATCLLPGADRYLQEKISETQEAIDGEAAPLVATLHGPVRTDVYESTSATAKKETVINVGRE